MSNTRNTEEELRILITNSPLGIALTDAKGKFLFVNQAFHEMVGYSFEEITAMGVADVTHPDSLEKSKQAMTHVTSGNGSTAIEKRYVCKDGGIVTAITRLACVFDDDNQPQYMCTNIENITKQKQTREKLFNTLKRADSILKTALDGFIEFDSDGLIHRSNDMAEKIFGRSNEALYQENVNTMIFRGSAQEPSLLNWLEKNQHSATSEDFYGMHSLLGEFPIEISVTSTINEGSRFYNLFARNISERKQAADRQQYLATHDMLTGIPNRMLFMEVFNNVIAASRRNQSQHALLFIDLDNFKTINDAMGHHVGDELLKQVANRLRETIRESDSIARIGGDEYMLLLQDTETESGIRKAVEKLISIMTEAFTIDGNEVYTSCSIGIARYPEHGDNSEVLLRNADIAMYKAKNRGKNNYQIFNRSLDSEFSRKLSLETRLKTAIKNDELSIHYQAKFCLIKEKICGFEAFARWHTSDEGFISPVEFIPLAEETGLILPLGQYVLEKVCSETEAFCRNDLQGERIAVNVSPLQFNQRRFFHSIDDVLLNCSYDPSWLELEITESAIIDDFESSVKQIQRLREQGVSVAMDDFGVGYSSLNYLKKLPLDTLKIDKSFIDDIVTSEQSRKTVEFIIQLTRNHKLEVVAEGVETASQVRLLKQISCDRVQGFYLARPKPLRALIEDKNFSQTIRANYHQAFETGSSRSIS